MNKKVAGEIVKAGYRSLVKRYHPDAGGTHEAMIVLKETYENLEKCIENGNWSAKAGPRTAGPQQAKEETFHGYRKKPSGSDDFRQKAKGEAGQGPVLERWKPGYFVVRNVHVVGATPKAIQVMFPGNPVPAWMPRSQLHVDSIYAEGDRGDLIFTDWIASQKGWRLH
jgi:hypothetical protein